MHNSVTAIWRHKSVITGILLIVTALSAIYMSVITPVYRASALLLLEVSGYAANGNDVLNEVEILKSRTIASRAVGRLEHVTGKSRKAMAQHGDNASKERGFREFRSVMVYNYGELPEDIIPAEERSVTDDFLNGLSVRRIKGSSVIRLSYSSEDPAYAAMAVNFLIDAYIEKQSLDREANVKRMQNKLAELERRLAASEAAAEEYRVLNGLLSEDGTGALSSEIARLRAELKKTEREHDAAMQGLESAARSPEVLDSPVLRSLRIEEASARSKLAELSTRYLEKHPKIIEAVSALEAARNNVEKESERVTSVLRNEAAIILARGKAIREEITDMENMARAGEEKFAGLRELETASDLCRSEYLQLLENYRQVSGNDSTNDLGVRVISYAQLPLSPSFPNKKLFMSLSVLLSLFLGIAVSVVLERLDRSVRSASRLEEITGRPCVAAVPLIKKGKETGAAREAIRFLLVNLRMRTGSKAKVIAVTSAFSGEGKTTLCSWLGKFEAASGKKVLIVDCDMRRPSLHRFFSGEKGKTLNDYLAGQSSLEEILLKDKESGAHVVTAGKSPRSVVELLGSEAMGDFIREAKGEYDLVILDCPACLAAGDARIVVSMADFALYAVSWGKTHENSVRAGMKQFQDIGYDKTATVLTKINVKKYAGYGYGDLYGYYSGYNGT